MSDRNFRELLEAQWSRGKFVCVGLDPDVLEIPTAHILYSKYMDAGLLIRTFNRAIVDATLEIVGTYKLNSAFYEAYGDAGWIALRDTIAYIHKVASNVPVILDVKRGDIGKSNAGYVKAAFDYFQANAVTVSPYLGAEALKPFLAQTEKGIIVLCRTSNPGAGEFQDLEIRPRTWTQELQNIFANKMVMPLYQYVAFQVATNWNKNGNCALVVGATYPEELREVRSIVGDMPILIPGIGAQSGDLKKAVIAGKDSRGKGVMFNSSSGIIFASKGADFAEAARRETEKLRDLINQYRQKGD